MFKVAFVICTGTRAGTIPTQHSNGGILERVACAKTFLRPMTSTVIEKERRARYAGRASKTDGLDAPSCTTQGCFRALCFGDESICGSKRVSRSESGDALDLAFSEWRLIQELRQYLGASQRCRCSNRKLVNYPTMQARGAGLAKGCACEAPRLRFERNSDEIGVARTRARVTDERTVGEKPLVRADDQGLTLIRTTFSASLNRISIEPKPAFVSRPTHRITDSLSPM